jgi:branched-chain amino acid aminotransferase
MCGRYREDDMPLPRFAYYRHRLVPYDDARVGLLTHGLNYGTGAFAGLRGYWNADDEQLYLFRPIDHFRRLLESSRLLRMQLAITEAELLETLTSLLRAEDLRTDCYVRALAFYGDEVIGIRLHGLTPDLSMVAVPFGRYIAAANGAHVTFSSWCRVDDNVIPPRGKITGSYANGAFIKSDAELAGFDEAIVLNRAGQVSEGSAENVFIVRSGIVATPPVTGSILEGVTRRTVIHLLRAELGVPVEERPIDRSEVYLADELFLTGTAAQITPATRVDHRAIGSGAVGPIAAAMISLFADIAHGRLPRYREWCHAVYEVGGQAGREAAIA